jgi:tetratricopeptide (TPR) repeat protein
LGYIKLGQLRSQQKRWSGAEDSYRQALSRNPNSLSATEGLVAVDFARNRPADAVRLLQAEIERTYGSSTLFFLLGRAQLRNGKTEEARRSLTRSISLDNKNVNAVVLMAQLQVSGGKFEQGIASYQRAIELAPSNVELYVGLAAVYDSQGEWQKAQSLHQKALAIQPDYAPAANDLAYLMLEHGGDLNVALTLAETARRGLPTLPNSADTLGWAYYHGGSFSVAAPLLEEAVKRAIELHVSLPFRTDLPEAQTINPGPCRAPKSHQHRPEFSHRRSGPPSRKPDIRLLTSLARTARPISPDWRCKSLLVC